MDLKSKFYSFKNISQVIFNRNALKLLDSKAKTGRKKFGERLLSILDNFQPSAQFWQLISYLLVILGENINSARYIFDDIL